MLRISSIFTLISLSFLQEAVALNPGKPLTHFRLDSWKIDDELPHQTIQAILQSRQGYIWLGTHGGLVRFDGARFVAFDSQDGTVVDDRRISCLMESRDGSLWIGKDGSGVSCLKNGRWTSYTLREGLAHERIRAIVETGDRAIWIGTFGGGLVRFKDGRFSTFTDKDGLSDRHILSLCADRSGDLWIGTRRGLDRLVAGRISVFAGEAALRRAEILCLHEGGEGQLWVGTLGAGLFRLKDGQSVRYSTREGLPADSIQSVYQDQEGSLWIGTLGGGLARMVDGRFSQLTHREDLSDPNILSLVSDREGNLWIGTKDGLNKLSESPFVTHSARDGLPGDDVNTILESSDGKLWVGGQGGELSCLAGGKWSSYSTRDGLLGTEIGPMAEDPDGSLWIGSYGGLVQYKDGRFVNRTSLLRYPHVSAIGRVRDGVLVATGMRLSHFRGGSLSDQREIPINLKYVFQVHEDRNGDLWLATRAGLARMKDGQWELFTTKDGLASDVVHAIHEDPSGVLWLATRGGLSRCERGRFYNYTAGDGLTDNVIYKALEDDQRNLWLSGNRGICRVSMESLNARFLGQKTPLQVTAYNAADGLKSAECSGPTQPAGWKSRDGRLWFPTIRGAAVIDPRSGPRNALFPPVIIEGLTVDGTPMPLEDVVDVPPGRGNLEFQYTAMSFVAPRKVRFRYKLEGYDPEWLDAGTRRSANYTRIPPGSYRFRVTAANNDGIWNESGAQLSVQLRPHYYQTAWFYAVCGAGVLLAGWQIYSVHVNRLKSRFAAVIQERNRIAREIHDTLAQGFAGISAQLEAGKQMIFDAPSVAEEHLDQANMLARSCLEEARQYVWDLRHQSTGREGMAARLAELAHAIAGDVPFRMKVIGVSKRLPEPMERNLIRIGQEAIVNCIKHAGANQIEVELHFEPGQVRLRVHDDGKGFSPPSEAEAGTGGFGLLGMRERVRLMGGQLVLSSSPGEGTSIEVKVPLGSEC